MAQVPASIRRRKPATTSIHDKPPGVKEKLLGWGSWCLFILAILVFIFGGYAIYTKVTQAKIEHIQIVGVDTPAQLHIAHHLQDELKGGYFTTDLALIRDRALSLSWVERVVVVRSWPDKIVVQVTPRHAIARWGTGRFLSDDGMVFQPVQVGPTAHLPLLHGPVTQSRVMMIKYRDINQMFAPLGLHLKELYLTERMTWFMQFDSGLRLIVDQDQTMSKLQRLRDLSKSDLNLVWSKIAAVDLRYRNGMAIQWENSLAPPIRNGQFIVATETQIPTNIGLTQ